MRIGIVTETYHPEVNGVSLTLGSLATALSAQEHTVFVIRPNRNDLGRPDANNIKQVVVPGAPLPRYPGLRFGLPGVARLKRIFSDERPDILYLATEGPLGWSSLRAAGALGIPVISGFHTRFDEYLRHYGLGALHPLARRYLRYFHNHTQATLVPTVQLRDELERAGYCNLRLLRRAVDTALFAPTRRDQALRDQWGADKHTIVVLWAGRIAAEKNPRLAIAAFEAIKKRAPDAMFLWVGDGPIRESLAAEHSAFIFTGMLHGEQLARHYASADVFLFPSETDTFGNVVLEAMASGLAVLAFDSGAAREHITSGVDGCLAEPGDDRQFIDWADRLACDSALQEQIRTRAPKRVSDLHPYRVAQKFSNILASYVKETAA